MLSLLVRSSNRLPSG